MSIKRPPKSARMRPKSAPRTFHSSPRAPQERPRGPKQPQATPEVDVWSIWDSLWARFRVPGSLKNQQKVPYCRQKSRFSRFGARGPKTARKSPKMSPKRPPARPETRGIFSSPGPISPCTPSYLFVNSSQCNFNRAERPLSVTRAIFYRAGPISLCTPSYSSHSEPKATSIGLNARFPSPEVSFAPPARSPPAPPLFIAFAT